MFGRDRKRTVAVELGSLDVVVHKDVVDFEPRVLGDGRAAGTAVGAVTVLDLLPGVGGAHGGLDAEDGKIYRTLDRVFDAAREAVGAEGVAEVCESEGRRTKNGRRVKGAWACGWVARKRTTLEVGRVVALRDGDAAGLCGGKLLAFGGLRVCANTTRRLSSAVCVRLCV